MRPEEKFYDDRLVHHLNYIDRHFSFLLLNMCKQLGQKISCKKYLNTCKKDCKLYYLIIEQHLHHFRAAFNFALSTPCNHSYLIEKAKFFGCLFRLIGSAIIY